MVTSATMYLPEPWSWSVKVGDLVRYKHYHNNLKDVRGVVVAVKPHWTGRVERAHVIWNRPRVQGSDVMDWVNELEIVNEGR